MLERLYLREQAIGGTAALQRAYRRLCACLREALEDSPDMGRGKAEAERAAVRSLSEEIRRQHGGQWLQSLASLLAGLMHFAASDRGSLKLVNRRRPQKPFTTDPTSPALADLLGEAVLSCLVTEPVPGACRTVAAARRFVERAFSFRILDPSMEAGQLLLATALAAIRLVHQRHPPESREARLLVGSVLEKLCGDCLWGVDRSALAADTVRTLFGLLGAEFGLAALDVAHLEMADALAGARGGGGFDAVINNPPWGERMRPAERRRVRRQFASVHHRLDTYVAFMELNLQCLRPGGCFAVVLPAQVLGARNAGGLRAMLLEQAALDQLILLPRAPFARTGVRGLVLLGRAAPQTASARIRVTTYPLVKRLTEGGQPRSFTLSSRSLSACGATSWWPVVAAVGPTLGSRTLPLEGVAEVVVGIQVYHRGRGVPPQSAAVVRRRPFSFSLPVDGTVPAVRGRDVQPFCVRSPTCFIRFGKWLAGPGRHDEIRGSVRVFLRELCRRDGRLTAAIVAHGYIPLHGVLTLLPRAIDARLLTAILNSDSAAAFVRGHAASFSKVDFQKLTVNELRTMPIPVAAVKPACRAALGLPPATDSERARCREVLAAVAAFSSHPAAGASSSEKRLSWLDRAVRALF